MWKNNMKHGSVMLIKLKRENSLTETLKKSSDLSTWCIFLRHAGTNIFRKSEYAEVWMRFILVKALSLVTDLHFDLSYMDFFMQYFEKRAMQTKNSVQHKSVKTSTICHPISLTDFNISDVLCVRETKLALEGL